MRVLLGILTMVVAVAPAWGYQKPPSVCELLERRLEFNGEIVSVRGELNDHYHGRDLLPLDCKTQVVTDGYEWPSAICLRHTPQAVLPPELKGDFSRTQRDRSYIVTVTGRLETKERFASFPIARGESARDGYCHLNTAVAQLEYSLISDLEVRQPAYPLKLDNLPKRGDAYGAIGLMEVIFRGRGFGSEAVEKVDKYYSLVGPSVFQDWFHMVLAESYAICVEGARNSLKTLPSTLEGWKPPNYWWISRTEQYKRDEEDLAGLSLPSAAALLGTTATGTMKALEERLWILSCRDHAKLRSRARELLQIHFGVKPDDAKCPACATASAK